MLQERLMNLVIGFAVSIFVLVTIILSFASCSNYSYNLRGNDIFFGICIASVCVALLILVRNLIEFLPSILVPTKGNFLLVEMTTVIMEVSDLVAYCFR